MVTRRKTRSARLTLEHLERRDAPATLIGNNKVTYQDVDGDNVTVTLSKPILNAGNVNSIFTFDAGTVDGSNGSKQQLQSINLTSLGVAAAGVGITTSAARSSLNGGDGFAALGQIDATGIDLGAVTIDGDLGRIRAGDATTTTSGLKGLTAHSLGRFGTSTGAPDLDTLIQGPLDFLRVKTDVKEAHVQVLGGADGMLKSVTIGGSLIGGAGVNSGRIRSNGAMGVVRITGNVEGAGGNFSGQVFSGSTLAGVTIGGSLLGGAGGISGGINSIGAMGAVRISGNVEGAGGDSSGEVRSASTLAGVTIGGSLVGDAGFASGRIFSNGAMGAVRITGNVEGAGGDNSGLVSSSSTLAGATIGGSLIGGAGFASGRISSNGAMGVVGITGNVEGAGGDNSGLVFSNSTLAGATIGGSLIGGAGVVSGRIFSNGAMGAVRITGNVAGADGVASGEVFSNSTMAGVTIGGSLLGGAGDDSGRIRSNGAMGAVRITGNVEGAGGDNSGEVRSISTLAGATIGGSLIGGTGNRSGRIFSDGAMGAVRITGNVVGGSASGANNLQQSGFIQGQRIAALSIGGSLIAGTDNTTGTFADNGAIRAIDDIGSILIGNIIGNSTNPAIISARGSAVPTATSDVAIGSLRVRGRVEFAQIVAGVDTFGVAKNADAQIGAVIVGGDWIASSIVAGALNLGADNSLGGTGANADNVNFGDAHDFKMSGGGVKDEATVSSQIKSLTIAGQAIGTVGGADHFGVVAENVGAVKIGGTPLVLTLGNGNDDFALGITGDFRVNEI